jgi:hypothetical protein
MKTTLASLLLLLLLFLTTPAFADWKTKAFDEAQALADREREERKSVILAKHPELREYYESHLDILWRYRNKLNRMAFIYLLEVSPREINWGTNNWFMDYRFPETEREARYRRFIPEYEELRNQLYKHNEETRQRWQWAQDTQMKHIHAQEALLPKLVEIGEKYQGMREIMNAEVEARLSEQDGTGQPATRPESKPEGGDKPQPESEGRSR